MFPVNEQDAEFLSSIYRQCFSKSWSKKEIEHLINLCGFFGFWCTEGMIMCNTAVDEAEIYTICVLPSSRGKGIGKNLLNMALKHARLHKVQKMFLEVAKDNIPAIKLYNSAGFIEVGCRKKYYNNQTDALIMELKL